MSNLMGGIWQRRIGLRRSSWLLSALLSYFLCLTLKYPDMTITIINLILREVLDTESLSIDVQFLYSNKWPRSNAYRD